MTTAIRQVVPGSERPFELTTILPRADAAKLRSAEISRSITRSGSKDHVTQRPPPDARATAAKSSLLVEAACDTAAFATFLEQILLPELSAGDVIVLDNLNGHRAERAPFAAGERVVRRGGRLLFLPPCSPDLNPIERMFSKLKTALRSAAARTREALFAAFGNALASVTPDDLHHSCQSAIRTKRLDPLL